MFACRRTAFARFNAVPHYAYRKLKMPGPFSVITVNGRAKIPEIPLCTRTISTPSIPAYVKVNLQRKCKKWFCATERLSRSMWHVLTSNLESTAKLPDTAKGV